MAGAGRAVPARRPSRSTSRPAPSSRPRTSTAGRSTSASAASSPRRRGRRGVAGRAAGCSTRPSASSDGSAHLGGRAGLGEVAARPPARRPGRRPDPAGPLRPRARAPALASSRRRSAATSSLQGRARPGPRRDHLGQPARPGARRRPAQVATARGQAQVLLVGLLACALLVLVLAAQLLVRRRTGSLALARERGATLPGSAASWLSSPSWSRWPARPSGSPSPGCWPGRPAGRWSVPVVLVAAWPHPVLGARRAGPGHRRPAGAGQPRRAAYRGAARQAAPARARAGRGRAGRAPVRGAAPARRRSRRRPHAGQRARRGGRWPARSRWSACSPTGALVLRRSRRSAGRRGSSWRPGWRGRAARAAAGRRGGRGGPAVFGTALAATEQRGQAVGRAARRRRRRPAQALRPPARSRQGRRGGRGARRRAAVAGRVADGLRVLGARRAAVRLVVVDAAAYERLLAASDLPDAPQLAGWARGDDARCRPCCSAAPRARDGLRCAGTTSTSPLDVVGVAPRVGASTDPVVVVDADAFAAAGAVADPDTVWAVGPGPPRRCAGGRARTRPTPCRRTPRCSPAPRRAAAPRPGAPGRRVSLLLLLLAALGVVLGAAARPPRAPLRSAGCARSACRPRAAPGARRRAAGPVLAARSPGSRSASAPPW